MGSAKIHQCFDARERFFDTVTLGLGYISRQSEVSNKRLHIRHHLHLLNRRSLQNGLFHERHGQHLIIPVWHAWIVHISKRFVCECELAEIPGERMEQDCLVLYVKLHNNIVLRIEVRASHRTKRKRWVMLNVHRLADEVRAYLRGNLTRNGLCAYDFAG